MNNCMMKWGVNMNLKTIEIGINKFLADVKDKAFFDSKGNKIIHRISVGAQSAKHPFFTKLSNHIKGHLNPIDFFKEAFPLENNKNLSVVSFALHYSKEVVMDNSKENEYPSYSWFEMTDKFFYEIHEPLSKQIKALFGDCKLVFPTKSKLYVINGTEKIKAANWSERHVAFGCGLGSFGLHGALITELGCTSRLISIVTDKEFENYNTPFEDIYANCLHYQGKGCNQCVKRCPVGSVTSEKRIIENCFDREFVENKEISLEVYVKEITACGLCMTGVPCSFTNPMKMVKQ